MSPAPSHAARKVATSDPVVATDDFIRRLGCTSRGALKSQRVGYPLPERARRISTAMGIRSRVELWDLIKDKIGDAEMRADIQEKLDGGANGIEQALDLLDDGGAQDTPYRHLVTAAIAELFLPKIAPLGLHIEFVQRLSQRGEPLIKIFSLKYDPLVERAAERAKVRLLDGFLGMEHAFFHPPVFEERIGRI